MNFHTEAKTVNLAARPEDITIDPARTAVLVVDMQNAFASKGGMLDLIGLDISGAKSAIAATKKVIEVARAAKMKVVYLLLSYAPDLSNSGGVESPHWHKESGLILMRKKPELKGKILTRGTWDEAVVDELKPAPADIVIRKSRYSGFVGTNLDIVLKTYNIKYLVPRVLANYCFGCCQ
jgi:ureidoacrylate peracid hydrolase